MTPAPETIAIIATGVALAAVVLQQGRSLGTRLEARIARLDAGQQALARDLSALGERVARLETGQQALSERLTHLESGQKALAGEVTELRRDVKSLRHDLSALSERTARIEGAVIGPWRPEEAGTGKS